VSGCDSEPGVRKGDGMATAISDQRDLRAHRLSFHIGSFGLRVSLWDEAIGVRVLRNPSPEGKS